MKRIAVVIAFLIIAAVSFGAGDYLCVRKNGKTHKYALCETPFPTSGNGNLRVRYGGVTKFIPLAPSEPYNASSPLRLQRAGETRVAYPVSARQSAVITNYSSRTDFCANASHAYWAVGNLLYRYPEAGSAVSFAYNIIAIACSNDRIFVATADGKLWYSNINPGPNNWSGPWQFKYIPATSMVYQGDLYCLYDNKIRLYDFYLDLFATSPTLNNVSTSFDIDFYGRIVWASGNTINISTMDGVLVKSRNFPGPTWGSFVGLTVISSSYIVTSWANVNQVLDMDLAPVCRLGIDIGPLFKIKGVFGAMEIITSSSPTSNFLRYRMLQ